MRKKAEVGKVTEVRFFIGKKQIPLEELKNYTITSPAVLRLLDRVEKRRLQMCTTGEEQGEDLAGDADGTSEFLE